MRVHSHTTNQRQMNRHGLQRYRGCERSAETNLKHQAATGRLFREQDDPPVLV